MRLETVTSAQNPKIKDLLSLQEKTKARREKGLFVVEGAREFGHCVNAGFVVNTLFCCTEILCKEFASASYYLAKGDMTSLLSQAVDVSKEIIANIPLVVDIPAFLYNKVAYRGGTEGIIAEMEWRKKSLQDLKLDEHPLVVVLEGVEKPGNLGAVLRSADAAGADAVLLCDPLTDLYNPNLIRASIGAVFTRQVVCCSSEDAIDWLKERNIKIFTAQLQDSSWYYDCDMKGGTAIAIGTEATGLTDIWREAADAHIKIPMLGKLDSLNASVSAAILLFEAVRQRNS